MDPRICVVRRPAHEIGPVLLGIRIATYSGQRLGEPAKRALIVRIDGERLLEPANRIVQPPNLV